MSQEKNPFEFWQKRDGAASKKRNSPRVSPRLQQRAASYPVKPPSKKNSGTPPAARPDASELFRPVRISSVSNRPRNVAELARQFERSYRSPTSLPPSTVPPRRVPSPILPLRRRGNEERDRVALSAPPTLEKPPQRRFSRDKQRNKPAPAAPSFLSHLDGPLDLDEVTAQLEHVSFS